MMERYSTYKESGIEWIGEIPSHWEFKRLGFGIDTIVPMRDKPEDLTGEIPWIRIEDYDGKYIKKSKSNQGVSLDTIKKMNLKVYPVGSVITTCSCSFGTSMIVKEPLVSNQTFICLVPKNEFLFNEFLYYILDVWKEELEFQSSGSIQLYLSRDNFKSLRVLYPPRPEQEQIVKYLDEKTSQIDNLISITEKKIELLKQKRTSLINEVVTKGLNPDVELKDSGVEWIGKIPKHWFMNKVKRNTYVKGRVGWKGLKSDDFIEEGPYLITGTDFKPDGTINWENVYHVSIERYEEDPFIQLKYGDILITKDGTIGKVVLVNELPGLSCLNSGIFVTRPLKSEYLPRFFFHILNSSIFRTFVEFNSGGSTILHLYQNVFENFNFPLPPPYRTRTNS